jgi:hypothetical protein
LVQAVRERYHACSRDAKTRILEEFASVSGYHRKSAIRILNGAICPDEDKRGRRRPRIYDEAARQALIVLWKASDRVCGKRLKALLPILVPALERNGHLSLNAEFASKLATMSAATIDRLLREIRTVAGQRRKRRVPTVLRKSVPIRTFADWNDPAPGFMEIDLVSHCGDVAAGSFAHTLTLTDIASGWTECLPLLFRDSNLIVEAIDGLRKSLPFRLAGIDIDNGGEFLNDILLRYCTAEGIAFTRSRPYNKNDQAWVEQKNGSVVRRFVGYQRLEGTAAVEALARLYSATRLFVNFFPAVIQAQGEDPTRKPRHQTASLRSCRFCPTLARICSCRMRKPRITRVDTRSPKTSSLYLESIVPMPFYSACRWPTEQTARCDSCTDISRTMQEQTNEIRRFTTSSNFRCTA